MAIFVYLLMSGGLTGAFQVPTFYGPYENIYPFNQGQKLQTFQVNNGNIADQQGLKNYGFQNITENTNIEKGNKRSQQNEHSDKVKEEDTGEYYNSEKEKHESGKFEKHSHGNDKGRNRNGNRKRNKKLYKLDSTSTQDVAGKMTSLYRKYSPSGWTTKPAKTGFHDIYRRNERTTRKKYWNNHDRKGNFFRSGMNNGGRNVDMAGFKMDSGFNNIGFEQENNKDGGWIHGFVVSWKMKMAPNGTYVKYAEDMNEVLPPWRYF